MTLEITTGIKLKYNYKLKQFLGTEMHLHSVYLDQSVLNKQGPVLFKA